MPTINGVNIPSNIINPFEELDNNPVPPPQKNETPPAPTPDNSQSPNTPTLEPPKMDANSIALILLNIKNKMTDQQLKMGKDDIQTNMNKQKEMHDKILDQISKSMKAMKKAKKAGFWGKIFGWVAVAATVVIGVALVATGAGTAVGLLMIGLAVDQAVGLANKGKNLTGGLTKLIAKGLEKHMSKEHAQIWATVIVTGIILAATLGAGGYALLSSGAKAMSLTARIISTTATLVSAGAMIGGGTANIYEAGDEKDASDDDASKLEFQKFLAKFQAQADDETARIKKILAGLDESMSTVMDMMNNNDLSRTQIIRNTI